MPAGTGYARTRDNPARRPVQEATEAYLAWFLIGSRHDDHSSISANVVNNFRKPADTGIYRTLEQFSAYIRDISRTVVNTAGYSGVEIAPDWQQNALNIYDDTVQPTSRPK